MSATALPATSDEPPGWEPCSDRSLERHDELAGTAGFGERWLLIEIDGAWGAHAFFQSRLDPVVGRQLVRRAEAADIRPVAIRPYGRRADERRTRFRWRWALADARPGSEAVRWGEVSDPAELLALPLDGTAGEASDRPVVLVCTHARHDQCCAVRGRPVARALADAYPHDTWECSHLGGDRFAATMLVLPVGLSYGRVPRGEAVGIVERCVAGEVVEEYLRGRVSFSNVVQAAQAFARRASGDARIDAFAPLGEERIGDGQWRVRLDHDGEVVAVGVRARTSAPLLSTCAATQAVGVREFEPALIS